MLDSQKVESAKCIQTTRIDLIDTDVTVKDQWKLIGSRLEHLFIQDSVIWSKEELVVKEIVVKMSGKSKTINEMKIKVFFRGRKSSGMLTRLVYELSKDEVKPRES